MRRIFCFSLPVYGLISIHASYANDATCSAVLTSFKPLNFNPRIVRKRCDQRSTIWSIIICIFQSTHRTQTMRPGSKIKRLITTAFQSTHRTQTMRRNWRDDRPDGQDFNPRIVRKRCDTTIHFRIMYTPNFNPRIVRKRCDRMPKLILTKK